jgi:hypothetical protein
MAAAAAEQCVPAPVAAIWRYAWHTAGPASLYCECDLATAVAAPPEPQLDACSDSSPMRRTRKAELMACVLGHSPGSQGPSPSLLLDLELTEQQLVRDNPCLHASDSHDSNTAMHPTCRES